MGHAWTRTCQRDCQTECQNRCQTECQKRMPERLPERMSDCQKYFQSQKLCQKGVRVGITRRTYVFSPLKRHLTKDLQEPAEAQAPRGRARRPATEAAEGRGSPRKVGIFIGKQWENHWIGGVNRKFIELNGQFSSPVTDCRGLTRFNIEEPWKKSGFGCSYTGFTPATNSSALQTAI